MNKKWFKIAIGFLCVLLLILPVAVFVKMKHSIPAYEGHEKWPGLKQAVEVRWDHAGVPHIKAQSRLDSSYALGVVMARERLFQMELMRRIVNGELAEILGEKLLKSDILLRTLGLRNSAKAMIENHHDKWPEELKQNALAFLQGINDFQKRGPLPFEFFLLGIPVRDFTMEEVAGLSGYMALTFAEGLLTDPSYSKLLEKFPRDQVEEFFIRRSMNLGKVKKLGGLPSHLSTFIGDMKMAMQELENHVGLFHGSNSWVISGARSKSGKPLLANDPHIGYALPSVWFEAHIETPNWRFYGQYLPLVPFPGMGHDDKRAWAITMSEIDDLDLYLEEMNPDNPDQVKFMGKWTTVNKEQALIKVKGGSDVPLTIIHTPHGPLMDATQYASNKRLSLKWAQHLSENNVILTFWELSNAMTVDQFKKAISHATAPGFNMSWVDSDGHIAWQIMGRIPIRPPGVSGLGLLDGASGKHEYLGYLKPQLNPSQVDPPSGVIVTANSMPDVPFEHSEVSGYWQHHDRYDRIHQLLSQQKIWDLDSLKSVQTDEKVYEHEWRVRALLELLPKSVRQDQLHKSLFEKFSSWDGSAVKESWGASIYFPWTHWLIHEVVIDELGQEMFETLGKPNDLMFFLDHLLKSPNSAWWDDTRTPEKESSSQITARAFFKMLETGRETLGSNLDKWTWGKRHQLSFQHPLGKAKPLNLLFNLGPFDIGGGVSIINNTHWPRDNMNFEVRVGASVRRLIDMNNTGKSYGGLPNGNSGHRLSEFYQSDLQNHLNNIHRHQWFDWKEVEANTKYLLTMEQGQ